MSEKHYYIKKILGKYHNRYRIRDLSVREMCKYTEFNKTGLTENHLLVFRYKTCLLSLYYFYYQFFLRYRLWSVQYRLCKQIIFFLAYSRQTISQGSVTSTQRSPVQLAIWLAKIYRLFLSLKCEEYSNVPVEFF